MSKERPTILMLLQVNALSNMRKAQLGRLGPVAPRPDNAKRRAMSMGRQLSMLPSELQAKHEAEIRANAAKRFAKQGRPQLKVAMSQKTVAVHRKESRLLSGWQDMVSC